MFPCTSCGLCCQHISNIAELKDFDLGNGTCKHFDMINNICTIYEKRPDICRVDKMFDIKYHLYVTKEQFYRLNADVCNELQKKFHIDSSFRVKLK